MQIGPRYVGNPKAVPAWCPKVVGGRWAQRSFSNHGIIFQCTCSLANWDLGGLHSNSNSCQFPFEVNYNFMSICSPRLFANTRSPVYKDFGPSWILPGVSSCCHPRPHQAIPRLRLKMATLPGTLPRFWPLKMGTPMVLMVKPHWYQ